MRILIMMLLLAFVSSNAMAGWVLKSVNREGKVAMWIDPETIIKSGDNFKMWTMNDYPAPMKFNDMT